ncbi:hypothetical protein KA517_01810 [Candidatus Gracilibacteria bacterium]|nr:hypothetical protein [Candidatus Gracilibacteria bacterium]
MLQLPQFFPLLDQLQTQYGDAHLSATYGVGCTVKPRLCLVFMNPTARTVSTALDWTGIRACWLGTKNIWKLFHAVDLISSVDFQQTQSLKATAWTPDFAQHLYQSIAEQGVYVTSLGKCSQVDARPLPDSVFRAYLDQTYAEIVALQPEVIVTFGNQVSSVLLQKKISVSKYVATAHETLVVQDQPFQVYPTYYPVGLGMRNIGKAIDRLRMIRSQ